MAAPPVRPGDILGGKYKVERVLGVGGMGVVVAAVHVDLEQRVALKFMLKEALSDPDAGERFMREARAAVRLQSAHTARVTDVGKLRSGEPFMVMEYLEGQDLDVAVQRGGPVPQPVAVDYILQAAEAIAEAHALGMVHRDIKLKNLFLTRGVDGRDLVKVLDFGLAKTIGPAGGASLTHTSAVFGSPQYMSPEQMRSAKDVDARADIWALGICLYELLTTRVPFDAGSLPEICALVLKDAPAPIRAHVRTVDPALEAIVLRCLEKDPARRFQTVPELAAALEPFGAREGSSARIRDVAALAARNTPIEPITTRMSGAGDDESKTLDAWNSAGAGPPGLTRARLVVSAALGVGVAAVLVLALGVGLYVTRARRATVAAQSVATQPIAAPPTIASAVTEVAPSPRDAGAVEGASAATPLAPAPSDEPPPPPPRVTPPRPPPITGAPAAKVPSRRPPPTAPEDRP